MRESCASISNSLGIFSQRFDSVFYYDIDPLPLDQQAAFKAVHPEDTAYRYVMFREDGAQGRDTVDQRFVANPNDRFPPPARPPNRPAGPSDPTTPVANSR